MLTKMSDNGPIFTSTGQALAVSFQIMNCEIRERTGFLTVLLRIIEGVEMPSARLREWYTELRGSRGTVNFEGLDPYEVRGQCAMVTKAVDVLLPGPERDVIFAKYGFQKEKGDGVKGFSEYVTPQLAIVDETAIKALCYGFFDPQWRRPGKVDRPHGGLSYQEISEQRGIHIKTLKRANKIIATTADLLQIKAEMRLMPTFQRDGLIPMDDYAMVAA